MKHISLLLIQVTLLFTFTAFSEENNPCLHSWGDVQYDCNTSISAGTVHLGCKTTKAEAFAKLKSTVQKSGSCKKYRICTTCGERDNLGSKSFSDFSYGDLICSTDPGGHVEGGGSCEVSASCHTKHIATAYFSVYGHNYYLMTDAEHTHEYKCYMTGHLPQDKYSVSLSSLLVPIGLTHYFNVMWYDPDGKLPSDGYNEYRTKSCRECACTWDTWPEGVGHRTEYPYPPETTGTFGGTTWLGYGFYFTTPGAHYIKFTKKCLIHEVSLYNWNQVTTVGGCPPGEFKFNVTSVGIQALDHTTKDKPVYFKEIGETPPTEKTLYVLSEITEEEALRGGNKARQATEITFLATPTGSSWPSIDPYLGGIDDSKLSDDEKKAKVSYKYPTWNKWHSHCYGYTCLPDHFEFSGDPGSSIAVFKAKQTGSYVVEVNCGYENNASDSNDNLGTRKRFIKVCNPLAIADFGVPQNNEKQKVIDDLTPCDAQPIPITFGGDMNGIPEGEKAYLKIEADSKTYELYKDPAGEIEASAADLEFEVTGSQTRKTVYLLPIQKDSDTLFSTYKAVTKYGIAGTLVKSDDIEDTLIINWNSGGCSGGTCSAPWVSASNSSVKVQGSFGQGAWGKSGGAFQIYADKLNYRLLDNKVAQIGKNEDDEPIMSDPGIRFVYGNSSSVKIATAEDAASNSNYVEGYPIRVKTGRYCTEFTYRKATVGTFTFVDKMTVTQYLSSDTDAAVAMTGASPVAVTTLEMVYNSTIPADATEPLVTALNVINTQYSGTTSTTQTWGFTAPETSCPDLTGDYTISQLSQNGVNNILVKQEYTANGLKHRREIRYIGSMSNPVSKEDRTYCEYPWGEEVISETVKGATTTYEFYTDSTANGYSKQKKVTYPQGNYITYEYNDAHEVITQTELRGSLTYVTTFEYEYDANAKKRTTTTIQTVGDTVISKNKSITYEDRTGSNPDESIRFDENGNQYVTKTWYTQGPNGTYDIRPRRQENPDGTATVYTYSRSGNAETNTTETGVFNGDSLILGTRQVSISNENGVNVSTESWFIDSANGVYVKTASTVNSNFDEFGRARTTTYLDGSTVTRTYGCCGVASETDRDGVTTTYAYDEFKRVSHTVRDGITTLYSYDALGNQTSVTIKGKNDGEITTSKTYNNGELATSTDALGNVTSYTQSYSTSGNNSTYTETVTNPDNSTQITTSVNGQQVGFSGTAVHGQSVTQGANWQITTTPVAGNVNMTVKSYTDMLGRNFKTEYADGSYTMNYYNTKSQLIKSVTAGGVVTLYVYDNLGRQITQAIDMNRNGEIDSADLVTSTAYSYGTQDGKQVSITTQTRSQGANSAVISVKKQSVDGLENWETNLNGLTTHTKLERLGGGNIRQTVTNPDGTKVVTNSNNGKVITIQQINTDDTNGNLITYNYDEFNRQTGTVETFGTTSVNTSAATYDNNGNILTQTVNGQATSFEYDVMGRQTKVTAPGGVVTNTAYYPTGEVRRVDGATYPVEYSYNGIGKQATMTTFKDANTPQVTSWTYNARGEMVQKIYADGNKVTYTYNADGQLLTRTWARGVVTTYTYDNAGRATGYNYSDGVTPAVIITLDFLDRQSSITDAAGTRSFTYNANNQLGNETSPSIMNGMITYAYDNAGRRTGMNLSNGTDSFAQANYTYDTQGRIATVGNNTDTLTYTYVPGTNMIGSAAWQNASINTVNTYDQYKRLTNIAVNGENVYGYTLNDKNQRTSATLPDGNKWNYTYDVMGQLTGAVKQDTANNPLANMNYFYDLIGNRTSATENSATTTYTCNLVNQYTAVNAVVPVYDLDGNMTSYNGWNYTYNGENRLIVAENAAGVRVEADYDYMGRRLFKKVYTNNTLTKHSVFIYDGFKQIAEFDVLNNNSLKASYLWQPIGLDVVLLRNAEYLIADGNKNIIQIRNATGSVTDSYVYDPFGKVTHEGSSENPFQFSSEFFDSKTELVYYNHRYYISSLGKWINRDPSEEVGGLNLYAGCQNDTIGQFDVYGLWSKIGTIHNKSRALYEFSADDTFDGLADKIELSVVEYQKWSKFHLKIQTDDKKNQCGYSVPNVWVASDSLRGGAGIYARTVNLGGTIGIAVGTDLFTWGLKVVKADTPQEFLKKLRDNKGNIWGLVLFAHGDRYGTISNSSGDNRINQSHVFRALDANGYRIAKAYAMQCASASKQGRVWDPVKEGYTDINWEKEWKKRAIYFWGYQGTNALMIDFWWLR